VFLKKLLTNIKYSYQPLDSETRPAIPSDSQQQKLRIGCDHLLILRSPAQLGLNQHGWRRRGLWGMNWLMVMIVSVDL